MDRRDAGVGGFNWIELLEMILQMWRVWKVQNLFVFWSKSAMIWLRRRVKAIRELLETKSSQNRTLHEQSKTSCWTSASLGDSNPSSLVILWRYTRGVLGWLREVCFTSVGRR